MTPEVNETDWFTALVLVPEYKSAVVVPLGAVATLVVTVAVTVVQLVEKSSDFPFLL